MFQHYKVLRIISEAVSLSIPQSKKYRPSNSVDLITYDRIPFIHVEDKPKPTHKTFPSSYLSAAKDWKILKALNNFHHIYPPALYTISQCPDILVFSIGSFGRN